MGCSDSAPTAGAAPKNRALSKKKKGGSVVRKKTVKMGGNSELQFDSCINDALDYNAVLMAAGVDKLGKQQMEDYMAYWYDFVDCIGGMTLLEYENQIKWAGRMQNDPEYAKVWIHTLKELYELEDVNGDKQLQKDEFEKFWQTLVTILYSPDRALSESTPEKIDRAWAALKHFSDGEVVTWDDFMKSHQIIMAWCDAGLLMHELEKRGHLKRMLSPPTSFC